MGWLDLSPNISVMILNYWQDKNCQTEEYNIVHCKRCIIKI